MSLSSRRLWNWIAIVLIAAFFGGLCTLVFSKLSPGWNWSKPWDYRGLLLSGWWCTLILSLGSLVGSLLVGVLLMLGQRSPLPAVKWTCRIFLEFVRDTPLLVQLLVGYFMIFAPLMSRSLESIGWNDKLVIGMILLSLFQGAYLGEILRGGVESIPRTQWESARAVGFNRGQVYRHVIFPQALRRVLPAIAGQFVSLIKDSSLLSVIGVQEFAYQARVYTSRTYGGLEAYVPLAIGYLVLTAPIAFLAHRLERRFRDET
ncbi:amino acid ABC transporter permease [Luteolibacter sp. GHJ8]|uniref:Amino acid ABC transporter permease n=1 Tax=Luteolibacter rhizosphaerae TaxID=2989719 RepID=A0ABT3G369_9BACT|nr:amino acid ABC transporter permease [Luteolibacter rhizosphaerae]MCW1914301.1 amino acid ABC transporter permease [Luteolibacter rhizosphaerae]